MGRFDISPEVAEEYRGKFREGVQPFLSEPVLAGGLPGTFLLAVTPSRVHAFKYKLKRNGVDVKEEVAAWDRAGLEVATERLQTTTRVSLQWPQDGEKMVCDQDGMGDNPWADEVVRVLEGSD